MCVCDHQLLLLHLYNPIISGGKQEKKKTLFDSEQWTRCSASVIDAFMRMNRI